MIRLFSDGCFFFQGINERGWNQEFRCMAGNVLISKKLDRDIGNRKHSGVHLRPNLKAIVAVEALLQTEGWLNEPEHERPTFENMDGSAILTSEMAGFWFRCGQNRDVGIQSILRKEEVKFKDVLATNLESDSKSKDLKTMVKKLPKLISEIANTNPTKGYLSELFKTEILHCKNLNKVAEFFALVSKIVNDAKEVLSDQQFDDSDNPDSESDETGFC